MEKSETILSDGIRTNSRIESILIAIPISRKWAVEMQVKQMVALHQFTDIKMHILFFIDNVEVPEHYVEDRCSYYELTIPYTIVNTKRKAPHEIRLFYRRDRIVEMLEMMQMQIKQMPEQYEMLFMVEDDTKIEQDTLHKLLKDHKELTDQKVNVGIIEGVQVGRHGIRMIGAWRCDDVENPTKMATIPYNRTGFFEKIDGGGLYCYIVPMKLFLEHTFYWHDECFAPDVTFGIELRKKGYVNIIDWTVVTGHCDQNGGVLYPNENCTVAEYEKQENGEWKLVNSKRKGSIS